MGFMSCGLPRKCPRSSYAFWSFSVRALDTSAWPADAGLAWSAADAIRKNLLQELKLLARVRAAARYTSKVELSVYTCPPIGSVPNMRYLPKTITMVPNKDSILGTITMVWVDTSHNIETLN